MFGKLKKLHLGKIALVAGVVILGGSAVAAAAPAHRIGGRERGGSVVTSVNGTSTAGTCGVASAAGTFTVVGKHLQIVTVEVSSPGTTFIDSSDPSPSFADVCVGNHVTIIGTYSSGALSATSVTVLPPNTAQPKGVVTSVNGISTAGTCGVASAAGTFTYVGRRLRIVTVNVSSPGTAFIDSADPSPSFHDVCVGSNVEILGTFSSGSLAASSVTVLPTSTDSITGIVSSVNGSAASSACGVAGDPGVFTVVPRRHPAIVTVDVTSPGTTFTDSAVTTPSFGDVCVGVGVKAVGTFSSGTLTATSVEVIPPETSRDQGIVTSVNGNSGPDSCGTAATAGDFTLIGNWSRGIVTVEVTLTTTFTDLAVWDPTPVVTDPTPAVMSPSFADVCVGGHVAVVGTLASTDTLTASSVAVLPNGPIPLPVYQGQGRG
ncbi:MAG: hypothetical protein ACLP36_01060 [Acidimicrobiales bacterium]|jgi:hypothetical protein